MLEEPDRVARQWDEHTRKYSGRKSGLYWYELDKILEHVNRRISGDEGIGWAEYAPKKYFGPHLFLERIAFFGCGVGDLERKLAGLRVFGHYDAFDLSLEAIERATKSAKEAGYRNIDYRVANLNQTRLSEAASDSGWFYGSLHHIK